MHIYNYIESHKLLKLPTTIDEWHEYTKFLFSDVVTPASSYLTYLLLIAFIYEKQNKRLSWKLLIYISSRLSILHSTLVKKYQKTGSSSSSSTLISTCTICYGNTMNFIVPCQHIVCTSCQLQLYIKKCPMCRGPIDSNMYTQILDLLNIVTLYCPAKKHFSIDSFIKFSDCDCVDCK